MPLTDLSNLIQGVKGAQHGGTRGGTDKKWHCPLWKGANHKENRHYYSETHPVGSCEHGIQDRRASLEVLVGSVSVGTPPYYLTSGDYKQVEYTEKML